MRIKSSFVDFYDWDQYISHDKNDSTFVREAGEPQKLEFKYEIDDVPNLTMPDEDENGNVVGCTREWFTARYLIIGIGDVVRAIRMPERPSVYWYSDVCKEVKTRKIDEKYRNYSFPVFYQTERKSRLWTDQIVDVGQEYADVGEGLVKLIRENVPDQAIFVGTIYAEGSSRWRERKYQGRCNNTFYTGISFMECKPLMEITQRVFADINIPQEIDLFLNKEENGKIPDNATNEVKVERNGFDKKKSFRHR